MTSSKKVPVWAKIVVVLCVLVLLGIGGGIAFVDAVIQPNVKRGVIIIPGLFASSLYDADTGEMIWDPFEEYDLWITDILRDGADINYDTVKVLSAAILEEIVHLIDNGGEGDGTSFLYKMCALDEEGNSTFNIQPVAFDKDNRYSFGLMNAHTQMWNYFEEKYGKTHEVTVFNYDFRQDNLITAEKLEAYVNERGYDEVILASHSNGGLVVANYLARSEENRKKVDYYLSYATPFFGSIEALTALEDVDGMIDGILSLLPDSLAGVKTLVRTAFETQFKPLVNMYVLYQLLPTYDLICTPHYSYEWVEENHTPGQETETVTTEYYDGMININGYDVHFENADELYEFYCSRPWAKDSEGNLRKQMVDWKNYADASFVTVDGRRVHSTTLVDTVYICGTGYSTEYAVRYSMTEDDMYLSRVYSENQGDGTVLLYSGTAGTGNIYNLVSVPFANHFDVAQRFDRFTKDLTDQAVADRTDWKDELRSKWAARTASEE